MALPLHTVAIAGPGLIGGSLALAARAAGLRVLVWTPDETEVAALQSAGFVAATDEAVVAEAELLALCVPIDAQIPVSQLLAPHVAPEATVTDVASVKAVLAPEMRGLFGHRYVGAHPMAGSERSGFAAAEAGLFRGRSCFLVPSEDSAQTERAAGFWQLVGCSLLPVGAQEHDATVARVSHLPVLVAAALVNAAGAQPERLAAAGPGFRDTTRVAGSPPELWRGILTANRAEALAALAEFSTELEALRAALARPDEGVQLEQLLTRAATTRFGLTCAPGKS